MNLPTDHRQNIEYTYYGDAAVHCMLVEGKPGCDVKEESCTNEEETGYKVKDMSAMVEWRSKYID